MIYAISECFGLKDMSKQYLIYQYVFVVNLTYCLPLSPAYNRPSVRPNVCMYVCMYVCMALGCCISHANKC